MTHEERAAKWLDEARPTGIVISLAEQFRDVEREVIPENFLMEQQEQRAELLDKLRAIVAAGDALREALIDRDEFMPPGGHPEVRAWDEATKEVKR